MSETPLSQLKALVVRPICTALGHAEPAAINLVTGTAVAESDAVYIEQVGGGPARGLWEMEQATHDDIWANFLAYQPDLAAVVSGLLTHQDRFEQLVTNTAYACAMCRIDYLRAPEPLPAADDAAGLSAYHKQHYNSSLGKANAAANVPKFQLAIAA